MRKETSMRSQVLLVTLAVLAVLAALPLTSKGSGEEEGGATAAVTDAAANSGLWPCCNQCGICNRRNPPDCQCMDISYQGCNRGCRNCIKYTASGSILERPVYRCADTITNFCRRRCTKKAAAI